MARWLKGVCLSLAALRPDNEHDQHPASISRCAGECFCEGMILWIQSWSRLRAAVFVNLVAMRDAISNKINDFPVLREENLRILQTASYLWHSAHNCPVFAMLLFQRVCSLHPLRQNDTLFEPRSCFGGHITRTFGMENSTQTPQVSWLFG